jgi:hypothetical protein
MVVEGGEGARGVLTDGLAGREDWGRKGAPVLNAAAARVVVRRPTSGSGLLAPSGQDGARWEQPALVVAGGIPYTLYMKPAGTLSSCCG